ncbi:hypothetical protein J4E85_008502 [Alternaria conjuncta]|uniref:uncharacterized protein n=1 Tax=Alternaria conjuncta TaxID=181017 RepID=UPI002220B4DD|nr:uncharacterized protein J4E85_008502 [Alternaria conjuncta]KAI4923464.1 hypothetical protein J4E85_008502 [Alternaria conjuncta]
MPWDFGVLSFICGAIKLSWIIYEKGFTEEKSLRLSSPATPPTFRANRIVLARRYLEFGDALFRLHWSLNTIESIVRTANTGLENERLESYGPELYDTTALIDIVGNFRLTLEQCQKLLNDVSKFRTGKDGFITNIIYNLNTDAQVRDLTERLKYHSVKIGLVLDACGISTMNNTKIWRSEFRS